jgi:hypothetical protein
LLVVDLLFDPFARAAAFCVFFEVPVTEKHRDLLLLPTSKFEDLGGKIEKGDTNK